MKSFENFCAAVTVDDPYVSDVLICFQCLEMHLKARVYTLHLPRVATVCKIGNTQKYSKNTIWGLSEGTLQNIQKILPGMET